MSAESEVQSQDSRDCLCSVDVALVQYPAVVSLVRGGVSGKLQRCVFQTCADADSPSHLHSSPSIRAARFCCITRCRFLRKSFVEEPMEIQLGGSGSNQEEDLKCIFRTTPHPPFRNTRKLRKSCKQSVSYVHIPTDLESHLVLFHDRPTGGSRVVCGPRDPFLPLSSVLATTLNIAPCQVNMMHDPWLCYRTVLPQGTWAP